MKRCEVGRRRRSGRIFSARGISQAIAGVSILLAFLAMAALPVPGAQVRLPQGQMVRVKLHNLLTTENVEKDDTVDFDVADDVVVGGHVVIAKGAPARGKVVRVKGAGKKKAKDAEVVFRFTSVTAVDNQQIPVRGVPAKSKKSDSKENEIPVNTPIPGMAERMVGAEKGREYACYTDTDAIIRAPETPAAVSAVQEPAVTTPVASSAAPAPAAPAASLSGLGGDPAAVDFSSDPSGADIMIDGSFVGNTPSNLRVAPGRHVIDLKMSGYRSWSRTMIVEPGSHPAIRVTLEKE